MIPFIGIYIAKPIDLLAEYVNPEEDDFELQVNEPYSILMVRSSFIFTIYYCASSQYTMINTACFLW